MLNHMDEDPEQNQRSIKYDKEQNKVTNFPCKIRILPLQTCSKYMKNDFKEKHILFVCFQANVWFRLYSTDFRRIFADFEEQQVNV
jgi:hypothetical protein